MAGLDHIFNRKLVLVTGKGGVGKTTVSAALAIAARAAGRRVLLAEATSDVGASSPLLGLFGVPNPKTEEPVKMDGGLFGVRITPSAGHRLFLRAALRVRIVADTAMRSAALNRFLMAAPAFPEVGTLYQLVDLLGRPDFDTLVVDLPATGHALGLVSLPRTVLKVLPSGLIGDAIRSGLDTMTDPALTSAVVVTLPETLPVTESVELVEGMRALSVPVGAMILNAMPIDDLDDSDVAILDAHLRTRPDHLLLGTRELRRLQRARQARKVFFAAVPEGVTGLEVPILEGAGFSKAVAHVGRVLGGAA